MYAHRTASPAAVVLCNLSIIGAIWLILAAVMSRLLRKHLRIGRGPEGGPGQSASVGHYPENTD